MYKNEKCRWSSKSFLVDLIKDPFFYNDHGAFFNKLERGNWQKVKGDIEDIGKSVVINMSTAFHWTLLKLKRAPLEVIFMFF